MASAEPSIFVEIAGAKLTRELFQQDPKQG
jgi:hypothetical protein